MPRPWPHRVSFPFFPVLELAEPHRHLARFAADLWNVLIYQQLSRHPVLSLIDLDDGGQISMAGDSDSPEDQAETAKVIDYAFLQDRRDELCWFELGLDPAQASYVTLKVRGRGGQVDEFKAAGPNLISGLVQQVLGQWLATRQLPPLPRPLPQLFVSEFWEAVRAIEQIADAIQADNMNGVLAIAGGLKYVPTAVLRLCLTHMSGPWESAFEQRVRELEPDDPIAQRSEFFRLLGEQGEKLDRTLMRQVIAGAPGWGKPHLSMFGDNVPAEQALRHQSLAALYMPSNCYALDNYGVHLMEAYRHEEAYRYFDRSTRMSPGFEKSYQHCINAARATGRMGQAFQEAVVRYRFYQAWRDSGQELTASALRSIGHAQLKLAWAHRDVGRLDEALEIYRQALPDLADEESTRKTFSAWADDPEVLGSAFAREGHYRRDPARVLAGFGRGTVDTSTDVAMLIHALIAVGKEELAPICFAHFHGADIIGGGVSRLAGARAFLLSGDLLRAIDQIQITQLRLPQSQWESEIDRLWRLAAARPAAAWEREVQRRLDAGALRLAQLLARDLADFVPGLEASLPVGRALFGDAPPAATPFADAWLEPLRSAVGPDTAVPVDDFFHKLAQPGGGLGAADTMVNQWPQLLGAVNLEDPATGATALYTMAQALCRYFAATTQAPSVMAGGFRQIANQALTLAARASIAESWLRPLLEAVEAAAGAVDYWLLDSWLLRLERAFTLEDNTGGHPDVLTAGLRRVASSLRGDERISFELGMAQELRQDPQMLHRARFLYERMVRAVGTGLPAVAWSEVADACLPADKALDVHWTAALANPAHAVPWVNLARRSFELGKHEQAVEALIAAFPPTGKQWRMNQLEKLRPLWQAAGVPTPFDFQAAASQGVAALQAGQTELAVACLRWCDAVDPNNKGVLNNLGIAQARAGDVYETVRTFARIDRDEGPFTAGQGLVGAQKYAEAVRVHRYGSTFWRSADKWTVLGGAAWFAEDDETAAEAYETAFKQKQGRLSVSELNLFAGSLCGAGQYQRAAEIAELVVKAAGNDPTFYSGGMHAMARALLGQDRADEAVPYAEQAVKVNPLPDNAKEFEDTLRRAMRNDPAPQRPWRWRERRFAAWQRLEQGDTGSAMGIALPALAANSTDFPLWRIKLTALELRGAEHLANLNPAGALAAAEALAATTGASDLEAALVRILALGVREQASFPVDPVVPLGRQLEWNQLEPELRERRQRSVPQPGAPAAAAAPALDPAAQARAAQVAQAAAAGAAGTDSDPVVFPGQKIAKLSDYVGLMKAMQGNDPMGALARAGLDMASYGPLAMQWSQRMAGDPALTARFTQLMRG